MDSPESGRPVAVALAVLVLASTSVALAGTPASGRPVDATPGEEFAPDARGMADVARPSPVAEATVTATGGRARALGTDDVLGGVERNLTMTQRLDLTPGDPGRIRVTHVFSVPEGVTSVETTVPEGATVRATEGFEGAGGRRYRWDGETARATITYTTRVNETVELGGPEGFEGRYLFADAGEWALVRRPQTSVNWAWQGTEPVGYVREATTVGPGYVGEAVVYMGRHRTHTRTAHGQRFRLVVPRRASLAESPDAVLDALADASDRLRVGDRDETVHVVAAPTTGVSWGVRGLQFGDAALWVRDEEQLGVPDNTWLHEYTHARQAFETRKTGRWLTEATATYYSSLLAFEGGHVRYDEFRDFLAFGARRPQSDAVLSAPATWDNAANYWKGALVVGALDRRIRLGTDRTRSFGTVFSRLNDRQEPVNGTAFAAAVRSVAGPDTAASASSLTTTGRVPETWTAAEHEAAFATPPARFTYRFGGAGTETVRVTGPYRNVTLGGSSVTVYAGETVTATTTVRNAGGATAAYEQSFAVGAGVRETVSGRLGPGETATHTVTYMPQATGRHTLRFGTDAVEVRVFEPATASIANVTVDPLRLDGPGTTTVTVTVANEFGVPARRGVTVTRDGQSVASETVFLEPGARRTLSVPVELQSTGKHRIGVADAGSATAVVGDSGGGATGVGPGFGPLVALFGLVLAGLARRRRHS